MAPRKATGHSIIIDVSTNRSIPGDNLKASVAGRHIASHDVVRHASARISLEGVASSPWRCPSGGGAQCRLTALSSRTPHVEYQPFAFACAAQGKHHLRRHAAPAMGIINYWC